MLTVGDNELIVGNDELDVGGSKVASEREAYKATWARDPMNWLWFSGDVGKRAKKHLIINFILLYL